MGMTEAIQLFFSRYTDFQGRSRRAEYWWFFLAYMICVFVLAFLIGVIGGGFESMNPIGMIVMGIATLAGLAIIIPSIALGVRRFHDLGQTGWLVLVFAILAAIPLLGLLSMIAQLIWFAMPGTTGPNKYGPDPKSGHDVGVFS
ncbi:MAG: DUF805 domain-containing protein [Pseudomonadota bacterium]